MTSPDSLGLNLNLANFLMYAGMFLQVSILDVRSSQVFMHKLHTMHLMLISQFSHSSGHPEHVSVLGILTFLLFLL